MKKLSFTSLAALSAAFLLLLLPACSGGKGDKGNAKEKYAASLNDSIAQAEKEISECEIRLKQAGDSANVWMRDFTPVKNPREVEGYMIFSGWQNRYPLQSTGMVARINENEQLELIAALAGGRFTSIAVTTPYGTAFSDTVPHDQAMTYKRENLNTVMFSGARADSIARLISDNALNDVRVEFIENGVRGNWTMPGDYKKMVSATWMLYSARRDQIRLEGRIKMLHEKINLLRAHIDRHSDNPKNSDNR